MFGLEKPERRQWLLFPHCCFCPETEFWRSVWVGRHPKSGKGLLAFTKPGTPCPPEHVPKASPQCLGVRYSFQDRATHLGSSPLCSASCGCREPGAATLDFLPPCPPRPVRGCFFAQVLVGRREEGDFEKPQIYQNVIPLSMCLCCGRMGAQLSFPRLQV